MHFRHNRPQVLEIIFYNLTIFKIFSSESEWDAKKVIEKTCLDKNIWQQLRRESAVWPAAINTLPHVGLSFNSLDCPV